MLKVRVKAGHTIEVIRRLLPEFEESTGIEVELEIVQEAAAHDGLLAGDNADVVTVPHWYVDELLARSALQPVTLTELGRAESDFPPLALSALTRRGRLWAVPHTFTGGTLSYRRDVFENAGLGTPRTLDDVLHAQVALRERDADRSRRWELAVRSNREFSSLESYAGWAAAKGLKLLPKTGAVDPQTVMDGIGDLVGTLRRDGQQLTHLDYAALGGRIVSGSAAQLLDTSAWAFAFEAPTSPVRGQMGYASIGREHPAQFVYAEGLGITATSRHSEDARRFLEWRHSARVVQCEVRLVRRIDLPRLDLRGHDWFQEFVDSASLRGCLDAIDESWKQARLDHVAFGPDYVPRARRLMSVISDTIAGRYRGLEEALELTEKPGYPRG